MRIERHGIRPPKDFGRRRRRSAARGSRERELCGRQEISDLASGEAAPSPLTPPKIDSVRAAPPAHGRAGAAAKARRARVAAREYRSRTPAQNNGRRRRRPEAAAPVHGARLRVGHGEFHAGDSDFHLLLGDAARQRRAARVENAEPNERGQRRRGAGSRRCRRRRGAGSRTCRRRRGAASPRCHAGIIIAAYAGGAIASLTVWSRFGAKSVRSAYLLQACLMTVGNFLFGMFSYGTTGLAENGSGLFAALAACRFLVGLEAGVMRRDRAGSPKAPRATMASSLRVGARRRARRLSQSGRAPAGTTRTSRSWTAARPRAASRTSPRTRASWASGSRRAPPSRRRAWPSPSESATRI